MDKLMSKLGLWLFGVGLLGLLGVGCGLGAASDNGEVMDNGAETAVLLPPSPTATPIPITNTQIANPLPPQLHLTNLGAEVVGLHQPAYLRLEVSGTAVISLTLHISQQLDNGLLQPLSYQSLLTDPLPDGIHQRPLIWYGESGTSTPLAAGPYRLTLVAENEAGASAEAFVDLTLTESDELVNGRSYLDPRHAFQLRLPDEWQTPVYSDTLLLSQYLTTTSQMQIIHTPELLPRTDDTALANQTIDQFGAISRLYQDHLPIADTRARRVAYGYYHADGSERRGVLLAFVKSGQGYVVDLEGEAEAERMLWQTAELIATSWQFVTVADLPPYWAWQEVGDYQVAHPHTYRYQELRGWHRFSQDRDTFWAMRLVGQSPVDSNELARRVQDAGAGVDNFNAEPAYWFELGQQQWLRVDFRYTNSREQRIQGVILLGMVGEETAVIWLESPLDGYEQVEQKQFLPMLLTLAP